MVDMVKACQSEISAHQQLLKSPAKFVKSNSDDMIDWGELKFEFLLLFSSYILAKCNEIIEILQGNSLQQQVCYLNILFYS